MGNTSLWVVCGRDGWYLVLGDEGGGVGGTGSKSVGALNRLIICQLFQTSVLILFFSLTALFSIEKVINVHGKKV